MTTTVPLPITLYSRVPQALRHTRLMTRCECSGVAFSEIARLVYQDGHSLQDAMERSGCGQVCTGCVPDLHSYLGAE